MNTEKLTAFFNKYFAYIFAALFFIAGVVLAFTANGTGDEGDSIMHYQIAKYAPFHHRLFFDHWAKPLYVLIAAAPSQFGIHGIKIFNLLLITLSAVFALQITTILGVPRKALVTVFMLMAPGAMIHAMSGLTEPMFGFFLSLAVWLYLRDKITLAVIIISFLPFVRSEGLMMCGVFAGILLLEKKFWQIPLLALGHVVYGVAGLHYHRNVMWVFKDIPYARLSSIYGHGTWMHFFLNMPFIFGVPLYILLGLGVLALLVNIFRKHYFWENKREIILVYGSFLTLLLGHVIFWALGIFNSLGLLRVLIGVLPMAAIIQLRGFNFAADLIPIPALKKAVIAGFIIYVLVFPFVSNPYAFDYKRDFCLRYDQQIQWNLAQDIMRDYPDYQNYNYYFDANYVSVALNFDYFKGGRCYEALGDTDHPKKAFLIWDDYYSKFECSTPLEDVIKNKNFVWVKEYFIPYDWKNNGRRTVLFKTRDF